MSSSESWLANVPLSRDGQNGAVWPAGQYPDFGIRQSDSESDWMSEVDSIFSDEEIALLDKERRRKDYLKRLNLSAKRRQQRRRREQEEQPILNKEWGRRTKMHQEGLIKGGTRAEHEQRLIKVQEAQGKWAKKEEEHMKKVQEEREQRQVEKATVLARLERERVKSEREKRLCRLQKEGDQARRLQTLTE